MENQFLFKSSDEIISIRIYSPASRWSRLGAVLIDILFIYIPALLILPFELYSFAKVLYVLFSVWVIIFLIVQMVLLTKQGQTVGKKFFKIKIVEVESGENGGFVKNVLLRSILNAILSFIPFYLILDFLYLFTDERRCLHDIIAGTKVINKI